LKRSTVDQYPPPPLPLPPLVVLLPDAAPSLCDVHAVASEASASTRTVTATESMRGVFICRSPAGANRPVRDAAWNARHTCAGWRARVEFGAATSDLSTLPCELNASGTGFIPHTLWGRARAKS
jgi:hypothetical protein